MRAAFRIALLGGTLFCSILAAEAVLRILNLVEPPPAAPVLRMPELYRVDPELGYTLRPSITTTYYYPVGSQRLIQVESNSDGFRSPREFDEPDSRLRVWVLGDSMVFGEGVAAADRFTEVIERIEPGWRVDNLGMTGWGLDLMVRAFERISQRIRPDVVVVAFYTDDFRRLQPFYAGMGYPIPKFELEGDRLVNVPFPTLPGWRRLRTVQAVEQTYWRFRRNRYELNGALLNRLRDASRTGVTLAVVFLPGHGDTDEDQERRRWLREWAEQSGVPFLDLTQTIHGAGIPATHLPNNSHFNEHGHRLAAETIHRFLRGAVASR